MNLITWTKTHAKLILALCEPPCLSRGTFQIAYLNKSIYTYEFMEVSGISSLCMVCTMREVGPRKRKGGWGGYWEVFNAPKGSRPEKVKYPGMGEPSIVK